MNPPTWRKSSRSTQGTSGECVEVARLAQDVGVRDSKNPQAGHLVLSRESFAILVQHIKDQV